VGTPRATKRNLTAEPHSKAAFDFPRPKKAGFAVHHWGKVRVLAEEPNFSLSDPETWSWWNPAVE
jgi:hypothetical protein